MEERLKERREFHRESKSASEKYVGVSLGIWPSTDLSMWEETTEVEIKMRKKAKESNKVNRAQGSHRILSLRFHMQEWEDLITPGQLNSLYKVIALEVITSYLKIKCHSCFTLTKLTNKS